MTRLKDNFESGKIIPYKDILTGNITENSFAVSFHAVLNGTADDVYNDAELYFNSTHITNNLKSIFSDVLTRVSKAGARPLLVIDTTFGGGKTHSLVGLYHLFKSPKIAKSNNYIKDILKEINLKEIPEISLVAIDGHNISSVKRESNARTLWGEIGKQLACYSLIEPFDQELRKPPANILSEMIESAKKPVLIIIDELVNHLKDAKAEKVKDTNLAEITVGFFHTLTDVIVNTEKSMLILTLPGTESVYSEEAEILEAYKGKIRGLCNREAAFTVPIEKSEINDIIKKRLFEKIDDRSARETAEKLQNFYIQNSENLPDKVVETSYYKKIINSYPFHPALIDLLYERISTINEFQKTRGVLRILSHVLRNIYDNRNLIKDDIVITSGIIDLNDNSIFQELTNKISRGQFQNVIRTDIVNEKSDAKCQILDNKEKFGPKVRLATSIYLYTLIGTVKEESKGCSFKELVLSTAVNKVLYPNDINDELEVLENNLWYIYKRSDKWYFDVEVNINRVIADEIENVSKSEYDKEIKDRLKKLFKKSDFFDVYIWEYDVRNPLKPTLVVIEHNDIKDDDDAYNLARNIIEKEGKGFRTNVMSPL